MEENYLHGVDTCIPGEIETAINLRTNENLLPEHLNVLKSKFTFQKLLQGAGFLATAIDGAFYSAFIYQTAPQGLEALCSELGVKLSPAIFNYICYAAIPAVICNFITDVSAVDVMREVNELTRAYSADENEQKVIKSIILATLLKILAVVANYPIAASADVVPVSDLITKYLTGTKAEALRYSSLIIICSLEGLYYMMFTNKRLQAHADALMNTFKHFRSFGKQISKHPLEYLEILVQVTANAVNRGVSIAFLVQLIGTTFFQLNSKSHFLLYSSIITGINSSIITYFSRYLSVHNKFLNSDFDLLTEAEHLQGKGLNSRFFLDAFFSVLRGSAAAMLTHVLLDESIVWKYALASGVGVITMTHSSYVHLKLHRKEDALEKISPADLIRRKLLHEREKLAKSPRTIDSEALPLMSVSSTKKNRSDKKRDLFDKLANAQRSKAINWGIAIVTNITQLFRFFAFCLFVQTVVKLIFENKIDNSAVFALTAFWGLEVYKNEQTLYQDSVTDNWTGMAARWQLQKNIERDKPLVNTANPSRFLAVKRTAAVLTTSFDDYSEENLKQILDNSQVEVQQVYDNSNPNTPNISRY